MGKVIVKRTFTGYSEDKKERVVATAKLEDLGQGAYFAVTAEVAERLGNNHYRTWAWGCNHDQIRAHIPHLAPYLKWHLVSVNSGPMHYIANALYWAGFSGWCDGKDNSPPHENHLKSTIVYGALDSDAEVDPMEFETKEELATWLNSRFEELMARFDGDMRVLFPDLTME